MAENLLYLGYTKGAFIYYSGYSHDSDGSIASYYADLEPNTTYTLKRWDNSSRWRVGLFTEDIVNLMPDAASSSITDYWDGDDPITFTTGNTNTHLVVYYTNSGEYSTRVMLNEGSTAEDYTAPTRKLPHAGIWYLASNNSRIIHDDLPDKIEPIMSPPYPAGIWYVESGQLTHSGLRSYAVAPKDKEDYGFPKEYFNVSTSDYITALKTNSITRYLMKIELLTYYETAIGDITKELCIDADGQININYQQMTRRSCSLTVANVDQKYVPSPNNPIWYQRKFKLWIGIEDNNGDIYWWSQGVYYVLSATGNAHSLSIEGIDKGGALDGTLKTNMAEAQYIVEAGCSISDIVKDTLGLNIGNNEEIVKSAIYGAANLPIDPIVPLVDITYNKQTIEADISVDANNYLGDLLVSLADSYGADIYYDRQGHLRLESLADIFYIDGYRRLGHQWDFIDLSSNFSDVNYEYSFDGVNAVTVYTNLSADVIALANAQAESKTDTRLNDEQMEIVEDYKAIQQEIKDYNINLNETVFGNIDTNNRQVLEWTEENLTRFAEAIQSWGENPDDLRGSISTVFGAWDTFDGVNIAFSPILQTESGAVLLVADVVFEYIDELIIQLGSGWTTEDMLALDATGLVMDGVLINKLIADVGSTAERTSMVMHYTGEYGAYNLAYQDVVGVAQSLNTTVEDVLLASEINSDTDDIKVANVSYTAYNTNPRSPLQIGAVGIRRMQNQEIDYIDTSQSDMEARCQQYAVMLLQKESLRGMNISFNCPIIPHLDVNKTIGLTDEYQGIDNGTFVIQSITIPLSSNSMKISATNINWLPVDLNIEETGVG